MNLEHSKKFLLLDAADLKNGAIFKNSINNSNHSDTAKDEFSYKERSKPLITKELHKIDRLMASILHNDLLSEDEKVTEYNNALSRYQDLKPQSQITQLASPAFVSKPKANTQIYDHSLGIAKNFKKKADDVLTLLQKNTDLSISNNGEVIINGNIIPNSNITDLLNVSVNPLIKNRSIPGWDKFSQLLISQNIPRSLINHRAVIQQTTALPHKTEDSSFTLNNWLAHDEKPLSPNKKSGKKRKFAD